jgi:prepilin-type N-terminal cleavage/methylation domain-containing protein
VIVIACDRHLARPRHRMGARGMTMLELMVGMVILGVMLAVTVPRMVTGRQLGPLRAAARDITALMRYARSTAVFGEIEVELRFKPETGQYTLDYDPLELEVQRRTSRRSQSRSSRPNRRFEEMVQRRAQQWLAVRTLPQGRSETPLVRFAAVETELEVESRVDRHSMLPVVVFYPDGTASAGRIILKTQGGHGISIQVLTATGMPTLTPGDIREDDQGVAS